MLVLALAAAALVGAASHSSDLDADMLSGADPLQTTGLEDEAVFHLGDGWRLTREEPTRTLPQRLDAGNFYARWAQGRDQPTWRGPALEESLHVTGEAQLTFWVEADPAVATTGPEDQGFPEYVVYFGTQESPVAVASPEGPNVKTAGDPVRITASLPTPPGGMVLEEGSHPVVILAPVQAQDDRGPRLEFLVNATGYDARVEAEAQPVHLPDYNTTTRERFTGTLAGSAYAADGATAAATHPLDVTGSTGRIDLQLGSAGAGVRDIDLQVLGPDGDLVAQSVTPHPTEGVVLHEPTLDEVGPGEWTVRVVNYGHAAVDYAVEASVADG
jgi:hypothetical protein